MKIVNLLKTAKFCGFEFFYKMRKRNLSFLILAGLFFSNILAWITVYELSKPPFLEVNFFEIGQGDAIFIVTPKKHQILIDGGPDSTILEKLAKEMPFWDRSLDLIILSHPEADHLSGLLEVLKRYKVENILWTGVVRNTSQYKEWLKLVEAESANVLIAKEGQRIKVGNLILDVLHPFENLTGKKLENSNDTSIVNRLVFGQNSFLFTGDITKSVEKELINHSNSFKLTTLDSDVLKVAHHGSKSSSAEEFIEKVSPKIAVIQVGKNNRYSHPHQEVLDTLERYGITILRTDRDGDIKIFSDGENLKILNPKH